MKQVMNFLSELKLNNNKEWFHANKARYEESRDKMLFITDLMINEIKKFDPEIPAMGPKDCLFRIFRDTRFSNNKEPYKTWFGSYIARGGRKSTRAGYYLHLEPEAAFIGGGIYMPEPGVLKALRTAIFDQPDVFRGIVENPGFTKVYPAIEGEKLKTNPKGFPPDFECIDLLRYKSYVFSKPVDMGLLTADEFLAEATNAFQVLYPANRFLNDALDNYL